MVRRSLIAVSCLLLALAIVSVSRSTVAVGQQSNRDRAPGAGSLRAAPADTPTPTPPNSPTPTQTPTPTETYCPRSTPEALWVEPVVSPTDRLTQTISVYLGNGDAVTVTAPSGVFGVLGATSLSHPVQVPIPLLANTVHDLTVTGSVKGWSFGNCHYDGYWLQTTQDRYGGPLTIVQSPVGAHRLYLPAVTGR